MPTGAWSNALAKRSSLCDALRSARPASRASRESETDTRALSRPPTMRAITPQLRCDVAGGEVRRFHCCPAMATVQLSASRASRPCPPTRVVPWRSSNEVPSGSMPVIARTSSGRRNAPTAEPRNAPSEARTGA